MHISIYSFPEGSYSSCDHYHKGKQKKGKPEGDKIAMKDGKVIQNGTEYTPEQFSQMQKGMKYLPLEHR